MPIGVLLAAIGAGLVIWLSRRRLSLRGELATAIRRRELYLHYQPIIELDTGICVGAEALVRWQRPDGTQVRPDLFIPLAEEAGMIAAVTDLVIENVVRDMRELLVADRSAHIAINLAAEDISSGRALKMISKHMAGSGILPQQIWMEATERGFLDLDRARTMLAQARRAGHSVAIDDFGVGFSSLQYLEQLPLDALKIDKSFIDAIGTESATSPVTPHIIDMAKELGLWVVAEGVESMPRTPPRTQPSRPLTGSGGVPPRNQQKKARQGKRGSLRSVDPRHAWMAWTTVVPAAGRHRAITDRRLRPGLRPCQQPRHAHRQQQQRQPSQLVRAARLQQHTPCNATGGDGQVPTGHQHRLRQIRGGTRTPCQCGLEQRGHRAEGHAPQDRCQQQRRRLARPQQQGQHRHDEPITATHTSVRR